jgi:hypothetical protein
MRVRCFLPILFLALSAAVILAAANPPVAAHVATVTINSREVTILHLRPEFESTIRMPEEITSVILGSPGKFKAEHSEGEPEYVFIKPITREAAQSNLLIGTKSGQHVALELISDSAAPAVDFLIEYRAVRSFLIAADSETPATSAAPSAGHSAAPVRVAAHPMDRAAVPLSTLDQELARQQKVNAPAWTKWPDRQIETAIGDMRQSNNEILLSYSILNSSPQPVEIVPPQIQMSGRKATNKKHSKGVISDQLEIRAYRLSAMRIQAGERADGVVVFDRPNFKESTEKLFLEIAQADQVDRPILIPLPFTPPVSAEGN